MTEEEIIQAMAKAMAQSVRDVGWSHYVKPARAAFYVAKDMLPKVSSEDQGSASA
jgi:hypothetical protein